MPAYRFKIHCCKEENRRTAHYHIIAGHENISPPFWSRDSGLKLASTRRNGTVRLAKEYERIKEEIAALSRARNRGERGGMPQQPLYEEVGIAEFWRSFRRGNDSFMCLIAKNFLGHCLLMPLHCDFVRRKEEETSLSLSSLSRHELARLAKMPAEVVTMKDLGITLQRVA